MCKRWTHLCDAYHVLIPPIIVREAQFYTDGDGRRQYLDLKADIDAGRASGLEVTAEMLAALHRLLRAGMLGRLDNGELAILAYLAAVPDAAGHIMVTGDGPATWIAEGLDITVMSIEEVMERAGFGTSIPDDRTDATKAAVARARKKGEQERLAGTVFDGTALEEWRRSRPLP